jgi:hypothetical protein
MEVGGDRPKYDRTARAIMLSYANGRDGLDCFIKICADSTSAIELIA